MNKTNNQETISKLKKAYSTLSQATNLIIAEEGPVRSWAESDEKVYNLYKKHLNNAKECGTEEGCSNTYTYLKSSLGTNNFDTDSWQKLILSDGSQVFLGGTNSTCNSNGAGSNGRCSKIHIDINGAKKPNIIGRDVFMFVLKDTGLYPAGCDYDDCVNGYGWGCACKILREGAINY